MPSKNDLSALKVEPKGKLKETAEKLAIAPTKETRGRKKLPAKAKASKPITLKFTPDEFAIIEEKAGLVKLATYLKDRLIKDTNVLK